ncbi:hypothetical protein SORBI_3002G144500 [Sorghum bicolor]|uniref:Uncharacterized protein n=1 Tax=Sorghum bicolor TaxID=4558 RepID=A0A1B6QBC5_SORBI|nr:hypothetical protein SORBI_3002G144500 [Sorghum bicolor]
MLCLLYSSHMDTTSSISLMPGHCASVSRAAPLMCSRLGHPSWPCVISPHYSPIIPAGHGLGDQTGLANDEQSRVLMPWQRLSSATCDGGAIGVAPFLRASHLDYHRSFDARHEFVIGSRSYSSRGV